ncbi:MAG: VOC family protein [Flavisolibacter sp.]
MRKLFFAIIILFITTPLNAQDSTFNFSLNHVALSVKDLNASADFYSKVLGLPEITNRTQNPGIRWFSIEEGKELHLISIVKENVVINKAVHFALTTPNFDAFVKALDRIKVEYYDWALTAHKLSIRPDGIKQIFFKDPDGYWIEVNSVAQK